jgi:hypothetical protein
MIDRTMASNRGNPSTKVIITPQLIELEHGLEKDLL